VNRRQFLGALGALLVFRGTPYADLDRHLGEHVPDDGRDRFTHDDLVGAWQPLGGESFVYPQALARLVVRDLTLEEPLGLALVGVGSSTGRDRDASSLGEFRELDECVAVGYARRELVSTREDDLANARLELVADPVTWYDLGENPRMIGAAIVYRLADELPVAFVGRGGFPFRAGGGDVSIIWGPCILRLDVPRPWFSPDFNPEFDL